MDLTPERRHQVRMALTLIMTGIISLMLLLGTNDIFQEEMETALYDGQTALPVSTYQTLVLTHPPTEAIPRVEFPTPTQETSMVTPTATHYTIRLKDGYAYEYGNIRAGADARAPIIGKLRVGEVLAYIDKVGEWYKVKLPTGRIGFIANWITIKE